MSRVNNHQTVRRDNERGAVLILVALGMTTLIGFLGLALDVGSIYNHRRYMQTAADAAALAGASEIYRGQSHATVLSSSALGATRNGFTAGSGVTVAVHHPPVSGYYVGNDDFVEVVINGPSVTFFMKVFGWNEVNVPARAVAGIAGPGRACLYALDMDMENAFWATSSANLQAPNCGIQVNSNHARAFRMESNSTVDAKHINVNGSYQLDGGVDVDPTPTPSAPRLPDPLAYLQAPPDGLACTHTNYKRVSGTNTPALSTTITIGGTTLPLGVFCGGILIEGSATVVDLAPGVYVLKGTQDKGSLQLKGGSIRCSACTGAANSAGVFMYLTGDGLTGTSSPYPYKPILVESSSTMQLRAYTYGPYAGVLFMDDRKVPEGDPNDGNKPYEHQFQSNTTSYLEGGLYFPNHVLNLQSSSSNTTAAAYSFIVARAVEIESNILWNLQSNLDTLGANYPIKKISLVE